MSRQAFFASQDAVPSQSLSRGRAEAVSNIRDKRRSSRAKVVDKGQPRRVTTTARLIPFGRKGKSRTAGACLTYESSSVDVVEEMLDDGADLFGEPENEAEHVSGHVPMEVCFACGNPHVLGILFEPMIAR